MCTFFHELVVNSIPRNNGTDGQKMGGKVSGESQMLDSLLSDPGD